MLWAVGFFFTYKTMNSNTSKAIFYQLKWQPLFKGIDYFECHQYIPNLLAVHAIRIDLGAPDLEFLVTPSNGDIPLDTDGLKTSTFLEKYQCQVAINGSFFYPKEQTEGVAKDIIGLSVSRGEVYSDHSGYDYPEYKPMALLISKGNRAWFDSAPIETNGVYNGIGGTLHLINNGKIFNVKILTDQYIPEIEIERNPLTAVGLDREDRYMYWVVIDGRQPDYSVGVTTTEMAIWMKWFGAYSAILLDGGQSTTLVVEGPDGKPKVMNRPITAGVPGTERVIGNHIGLYAKPLAE